MENKLVTWKSLRKDFPISEILDAFFAGLFYATLLFIPVFIMLAELLVVFMYLLTLFIVLIIIALICYVFVVHIFWRKSLLLKKEGINTNIKKLFLKNVIIVGSTILALGLVFIFAIVPILWV
ncbi:hypothetical protein RJI07_01200 [Mycoplasmatota bacterium WC30]